MIKNDDDINWNSDIVETKNIKNNSKFIENKIPVLDKMCKIVCIKFQSSGNSDILCKIKKNLGVIPGLKIGGILIKNKIKNLFNVQLLIWFD